MESQPQNIAKTNVSGGGGGVVTKSCPTLVTPWTVACQAPLSMGFSRQEYRSGLPFPSPGDLPHPGIEPVSLMPPEFSGEYFTTSTTWEALIGSCNKGVSMLKTL